MTSQHPCPVERLEEVEKLIAEVQAQIEQQREFIRRIEQAGENSELAREVLNALKDTQIMHEATRDRLLNETSKDLAPQVARSAP